MLSFVGLGLLLLFVCLFVFVCLFCLCVFVCVFLFVLFCCYLCASLPVQASYYEHTFPLSRLSV